MSRRKGGLFLPLDVNFWDDDRIVAVGEKPAVLYLAMCLASRRLGRGQHLRIEQIRRLHVTGWRQRLTSLIQAGLVDDLGTGTYRLRQVCPGPVRRYISPVLRAEVHARDGWACLECGTTERLELDHIVPWSHGGPDTFDNLRTLCKSCNCRRGARI